MRRRSERPAALRILVAIPTLILVMVMTTPAFAAHKLAHGTPSGPAARAFAADFTPPKDTEWGWDLGGFGGESRGKAIAHNPVVLIHGQGYDHGTWDVATEAPPGTLNVRRYMRAKGYTDQEVWGVSYNGAACFNTVSCGTDSEGNTEDVYNFIQAVRLYTASVKVDVVAHSLGVTVVRKAVRKHPDLLDQIEDMVLIAGANHGTSSCRGNETTWYGCDQVYPGSPWLADINSWNPDGDGDETPGPTRYMTVYDGSGVADTFYLTTPTYDDSKSPALTGARNRELTGELHLPLARGQAALDTYVPFLLATNDVRRLTRPTDLVLRSHAETGSDQTVLLALAALCLACGSLLLDTSRRLEHLLR